jgi:hypothetical protein
MVKALVTTITVAISFFVSTLSAISAVPAYADELWPTHYAMVKPGYDLAACALTVVNVDIVHVRVTSLNNGVGFSSMFLDLSKVLKNRARMSQISRLVCVESLNEVVPEEPISCTIGPCDEWPR